MSENSKIEWTDNTFNPWVGCTKISPACDFCYAEGWAKRTGQSDLWHGDRRRTSTANWRQPLKWDKEARRTGYAPDRYSETLLHRRFKHLRIRGEWFRAAPEIHDFIKDHTYVHTD